MSNTTSKRIFSNHLAQNSHNLQRVPQSRPFDSNFKDVTLPSLKERYKGNYNHVETSSGSYLPVPIEETSDGIFGNNAVEDSK